MSQNSEFAKLFPLDFSGYTLYMDTTEAIKHYYYNGWFPGSFVYALLINDTKLAMQRADYWHKGLVPQYIEWIEERMPGETWGSEKIVNNWMNGFTNGN